VSRFRARRPMTVALAAAALAAGAVGINTTAQAVYEDPTMNLTRTTSPYPGVGPHRPYVQEILIDKVIPLKNEAIINPTAHGYLFRAGQQNTNLTISQVNGRLRFVDKGTAKWKWLPKACHRISVPQGVGASCAIKSKFTLAAPMLVEVWPRLGNDVVDSTALSARFDISFLGDKGDDTARFGAGNDFFNGAQDNDTGYGGAGNDWIRTGIGDDFIDGQAGDDYLVGVDGKDVIYGGPGDDRLYGINNDDKLYAGEGTDFLSCGNGRDTASFQSSDRAISCESTS
jgi:serralysin